MHQRLMDSTRQENVVILGDNVAVPSVDETIGIGYR
jgi:hypothetical protein